jgi:hypothetical protein
VRVHQVVSQFDAMRMSTRRFTRLTNAFSKKFQSHLPRAALYFVYYGFIRIHKS